MAMRKKGTGEYSGVLATPMRFHHYPRATVLGGAVPDETWRAKQGELNAKNREQFFERVVALFTHYDVPAGDPWLLLFKLAEAHVPGFRFRERGETGQGRPSGIGTVEELFERVEQFREIIPLANKKGLKRACEITSNRRGSRCYGVKPATLRKWVTDAKRASADDLSSLVFPLARFLVDEVDTGAGTESKQRVRRK